MNDPRYSTIRGLLKEGQITTFTGIFTWIPYTVLARDFSTNNNRMKTAEIVNQDILPNESKLWRSHANGDQ